MSDKRNLVDWIIKLALLAILAVLAFWVCCRAGGAPVQSPKGAEQAQSWEIVATPTNLHIVVAPSAGLSWSWTTNPDNDWSNVVFIVSYEADVARPLVLWSTMIVPTNRFAFPPGWGKGFAGVTVSNTVTHLVNE